MECKNCTNQTPIRNVTHKIEDDFCGEECRRVYSMKQARHYLKITKVMVVTN